MPLMPVAQIVNPADDSVTATTVAGLAPAIDGKQGLIRGGASPYSFIALTYDATYGKWVSAETVYNVWPATNAAVTQTDITAIAEVNASNQPPHGLLPYKVFADAGLTLQVRYSALLAGGSSSKTCFSQVGTYTIDDASTSYGSLVFHAGTQISEATTTQTVRDSGWQVTSGITSRDFWLPTIGMFRTSGGAGIGITAARPSIRYRWAS